MADLIPPDYDQCQAEILTPQNPFRLGHTGERKRCENRPTLLAIEKSPGTDGKRGSMTVCDRCVEYLPTGRAFLVQLPHGLYAPKKEED